MADPEGEFRRLRRSLMAVEPNTPGAALDREVRSEADAIKGRGDSPEAQLAELRAFVTSLGLRRAA